MPTKAPARRTANPKPTSKKPLYAEHPAVAMERKAIAGLKEKSGRSLDEWVKVIRRDAPAGPLKARAAWLKKAHGLGTNYAAWLVGCADAAGGETGGWGAGGAAGEYKPDTLVDAMFSGKKAHMLPLYHAILKLAFALGKDVTVTPCSTMVPIRRRYVIAQVKPTTNTRLDLGFALKDTKPTGRLIDTGGFAKKDRITHRIPIEKAADLGAEVQKWLKRAYEMDA